jgi:GNAT superfamily N-acetyltransferase
MTAVRRNAKWLVRECRERADLERILRFRYIEYVERKGLFQDSADHQKRHLTDPIDSFATNFLAEADGAVVGSIRMNGFDRLVQTFCITEFDMTAVSSDIFAKGCIITRAMVHRDWRNTPVFADLALAVAKRLRDDGLRWMLIDTATSRRAGEEERFVSLYHSMGFKIWRQDAHVPGIGPGVVMLFDLDQALSDPKSLAQLYLGEQAGGRS